MSGAPTLLTRLVSGETATSSQPVKALTQVDRACKNSKSRMQVPSVVLRSAGR